MKKIFNIKLKVIFFYCFLMIGFSSLQAQNLITNSSYTGTYGQSAAAPNWTIHASTPDICSPGTDRDALTPAGWMFGQYNDANLSSNASCDMGTVCGMRDATSIEAIRTSVALTVGQSYDLYFEQANPGFASPFQGEGNGAGSITVSGVLAPQTSPVMAAPIMSNTTAITWSKVKMTFTATGTGNLIFTAKRASSACYVLMDNIYLVPSGSTTLGNAVANACFAGLLPLPPCTAGTVAPALTATTKGNTCPATTIDLTTITATNLPSGTTLTWHTGTPATTANKVTGTAVSVGTYYAAFYDATNDCYSGTSGSATTAVTATSIACGSTGGTVTNVCPATTINLTLHTQGTVPANTAVTWHTGTPATLANKVSNPTTAPAGTYYAAFEDATNNCYSPTMGPVTATSNTCGIGTDSDNDGVGNATDLDDDNDGVLDAEECSSLTQRFITTNFPNPNTGDITTVTGWTLTGIDGSNPLYSETSTAINFNTNNVLQAVSQNLTNVYLNENGLIPVAVTLKMTNSGDASLASSFLLQYGTVGAETTYATLTTTNGTGTSGTITYLNGATGSLSTFTMGPSFPLTVNLPASVASSGSFKITFDPSGRDISGTTQQKSSDDGSLFSISFQSCVDTDGDGNPNLLDLDSDNDGCSDAFEAGTTTSTTTNYQHTGIVGVNGFLNSLETTLESGVYNGIYTYSNVINSSVNICPVQAAGTIDCAKTQIFTAPVFGQAGQKTLIVTVNVTSAGCFTPITVSGSGMTVANNITQVCTTTTGVQTFSIPVNYDGTTLGTMNFTIGTTSNAGTCSADLTKTPKKAISDVWTLDCVPTVGPSLK